VSRHQKGKTSLGFTEARNSESQWHQLGYMQVCTSRQHPTTQVFYRPDALTVTQPTDIHASTTSRPTTHRQEILSDLHHFNDAVLDMQRGVAVHLQTLLRSADVGVQLHMTQFLHPHVHLRQQLQPQPTQHHLTFI